MAQVEEEVIRQRLLNDERPLKKVLKSFLDLVVACTAAGVDDAVMTQAHDAFQVDLALYRSNVSRIEIIGDMHQRELKQYLQTAAEIQLECESVAEDIKKLRVVKEIEQVSRQNKLLYDKLAKKVSELPARSETTQQIAAVEDDLKNLEEERIRLSERLAVRVKQVQSLYAVFSAVQQQLTADLRPSDFGLLQDVQQPGKTVDEAGAVETSTSTEARMDVDDSDGAIEQEMDGVA